MSLEQQIIELQRVIENLQGEVERLRVENEGLKQENEALKRQVAAQPKRQVASFIKVNKPKREEKRRKKRSAEDNAGRKRALASRIEVHRVEDCPVCGEKLSEGSRCYSREVIDIEPPQPVEIVEHRVMKGWCWQCRQWQKAEVKWEGIVRGQGRMGVRLMGLVAYMRSILRLPIRTIQAYLETMYQVDLSVGEISQLCQRAVESLAASAAQLKAEAQGSPSLHMDETGWRENGQNGYIWCLATDVPVPIRYFEYHLSRSGDIALEMLGDFCGHLVSDFYSAYNKYPGPHQPCWVHLLRDLHELRETHADDGAVVAWALGVKGMYRYAAEQLSHHLAADERQSLYHKLWHMAEQFGLLYATAYNHPCCALAKRLLRHLDELFQFILYDHVPADNNLAERTLRPLVVQRKISGGSRSRSGSDTRMKLASLFETWKTRHLNPLLECWRQLGYLFQPAPP
jgi:transposase